MRRWSHDHFDGPPPVGSSVFVRNLPNGVSESQLVDMFTEIGEILAVRVDWGPLPTATVDFVRQDSANLASKTFHGRLLNGELASERGRRRLKVSVKDQVCHTTGDDDNEFWRRELQAMRRPRAAEGRARASNVEDGQVVQCRPAVEAAKRCRPSEDRLRSCEGDELSTARRVRGRGEFAFGKPRPYQVASRGGS